MGFENIHITVDISKLKVIKNLVSRSRVFATEETVIKIL